MNPSIMTVKNAIRAIILLSIFSLTSCGIAKNSSKKENIDGDIYRKWVIVELNGKSVPEKVNGKQPFISFDRESNSYSASGGCNGIGGEFELKSNGKIKFSRGMSTMMACPDMSVEQGIGQMLTKADNFEIKEDTLIINQGKTIVAKMTTSREGANKNTSLEGTWELDYVLNTTETFESLYPQKKPTIKFNTAENKVSGENSCNNFFGGYTTGENNILKFGALGMTRKFCPGKGESVFMTNIEKVTRFSVSDDMLTFISDDIAVMRFHKI